MENYQEIYENLCEILSNEHILYINLRNAHWNVKGIDFKPVHTFCQELYEQSAENIDLIAERIKMIGFETPANYQFYLDNNTLTNDDFVGMDSKSIFEKLKKDFKEFNDILSLHLKSTKFDLGTESFLITLLEQKEKNYWFINSHLM